MSLQVENLEHNMAKVTIEVEAAKLDDAKTIGIRSEEHTSELQSHA